MTHEQKNSISTCYSRNREQDVDPDLNLGLSFETTAISISLDLKSAESTLDRQVMAVWRGGGRRKRECNVVKMKTYTLSATATCTLAVKQIEHYIHATVLLNSPQQSPRSSTVVSS